MREAWNKSVANTSPTAAMVGLIAGFGISHAIRVAAELGLADALADGPRSAQELASITGSNVASLKRLVRALVSVEVLAEDEVGRFALTAIGRTLRRDVPGSLRAWALTALGQECSAGWGELVRSVRTGEIAFEAVFGTDIWRYRAEHASSARVFDEAMAQLVTVYMDEVTDTYSFSDFESIVDVGGGSGSFMIALLQANPRMTGILCDLPHVAQSARRSLADAGLARRCEVVGGDIFESVPEGGDAYVLCRVLHDWNDERALAILKNCRKAVKAGGRLVIIERVVPERAQDVSPLVFVSDLQMMVMTGGCERSEVDWRMLLAKAGFSMRQIVPTASVMSVIEGEPA
jgi:SAM-dependent methyltransferase